MNFGARIEEHAKAAFARVPGHIEFQRSGFGPDFELRFSASPFDYHAVLRVSDKRVALEDHHLFAEIDSLAEQTIENILHGHAPLRPGYPKKDE